jgi:MFS superfamily sulfate permease-like transporter
MTGPTKRALYVLNNSLLFMGVSIYFGTGWSTAIFQFPVMPRLTVDNYYLHFIPQIDAATSFFTFLVTLIVVTCLIMIIGEWKTGLRWIPIVLLLAVVSATSLTMFVIFPVNDLLRKGIQDPEQLRRVIDKWKLLTEIRVGIWSFEWALMMLYFASKASSAPPR